MRPRYSGPLFMLEGRPRSWTKRPRGAPWSRGGRTWPGPTANWRQPRGSSTHGPTTSLRSPWCVLWPTPGLWLATYWRRFERGYRSEPRGRSNLRDALPLASHPAGVGSADGAVRHLLGSAAVAVRAGGLPSV